ncbi:hypothetical protein LY78DRAFT_423718 [Colletotrichum sublineola]|nr:hypothetical protein LY78DRAFT_423718 [Colletotrichum sublineola]
MRQKAKWRRKKDQRNLERGTGLSLLLVSVQPETDSRRPNPCLRWLTPPRSRFLDGLDHRSFLQMPVPMQSM